MRLQHTARLRRAKIQNQKRKRRFVIFFSVFFILILSIWFVFLSGIFRVKSVEIGESRFLNKAALEKDLENFLSNESVARNMIFTGSKDFRKFFDNYPQIETFDLKKNWKDKSIYLNIEDYEPIGLLVQKGELEKSFYFSKKGIIFSEILDDWEKLDWVVEDNSGRFYQLGDILLVEKDFNYFSKIKEELEKEFDLVSFNFEKDGLVAVLKPIQLERSNVWNIIIDPIDLERSLAALSNLIIGNFFEENSQLDYLDLRYLPNVYYKPI